MSTTGFDMRGLNPAPVTPLTREGAVAYAAIAAKLFVGDELYFHPTSEAVAAIVPTLPATVKVKVTPDGSAPHPAAQLIPASQRPAWSPATSLQGGWHRGCRCRRPPRARPAG